MSFKTEPIDVLYLFLANTREPESIIPGRTCTMNHLIATSRPPDRNRPPAGCHAGPDKRCAVLDRFSSGKSLV